MHTLLVVRQVVQYRHGFDALFSLVSWFFLIFLLRNSADLCVTTHLDSEASPWFASKLVPPRHKTPPPPCMHLPSTAIMRSVANRSTAAAALALTASARTVVSLASPSLPWVPRMNEMFYHQVLNHKS